MTESQSMELVFFLSKDKCNHPKDTRVVFDGRLYKVQSKECNGSWLDLSQHKDRDPAIFEAISNESIELVFFLQKDEHRHKDMRVVFDGSLYKVQQRITSCMEVWQDLSEHKDRDTAIAHAMLIEDDYRFYHECLQLLSVIAKGYDLDTEELAELMGEGFDYDVVEQIFEHATQEWERIATELAIGKMQKTLRGYGYEPGIYLVNIRNKHAEVEI